MRDRQDLPLVSATVRLAIALALAATPAVAETPPRKSDSLLGEVTLVDAAAGRLTVKADAGGSVSVTLREGASLLRTKPGATTLEGASPLAVGDIVVGDRVLVRGTLSEDKATFAARQVVVMSREDIARKLMPPIGTVDIHRWRHEWRKAHGSGSQLWGNEKDEKKDK